MPQKSEVNLKSISPDTINTKFSVSTNRLRWVCPNSKFKFKSTENLKPLEDIVGQERAIEAIRIGSELFAIGYNIFVTGISGTGRLTTVKKILQDVTSRNPEVFDFCFVHNFAKPDQPRLLRLQRGKGRIFANEMDDKINFLRQRLPKYFEEDNYQKLKKKLVEEFQEREIELLSEFDSKIKPYGFVRGALENEEGQSQMEVFPVVKGKPVKVDDLDEMVIKGDLKREDADKIKEYYRKFHNEIYDLVRLGMRNMQEFRKELSRLDKDSAHVIVDSVFTDMLEMFPYTKVQEYITEVKDYILNHLRIFVQSGSPIPQFAEVENGQINTEKFDIFAVNVILDNTHTKSAPVVIERNPTYSNLFGTKERVYDNRGFWRTDFTKIKSGSLLQADQGYLIVNADDLFNEPGVWISLKRVLLYNKLEIQPSDTFFQVSQSHLKPEPIDVNVKVIIIGGQTLYNLLYNYEKGFKKIFKINAQFDYETERSDKMLQHYARFVNKICTQEKLPHFSPDGVAAIVEWACEEAGAQNRITLKFSDVADIIRESAFYMKKIRTGLIQRQDVDRAINWRRRRHDLIDEKTKLHITNGDMLISTEGSRIGMINGLTVMSNGIITFGKPARITANISAGNKGIINIEREANLSGNIHNKGVMIISGFLQQKFAYKRPLALTASITFEQSYGGIDGDSASAAEIYVILSAISEIPIKQNIAITGSVNQKGDIQPIGGENEKIRGFFEVCDERGLTGDQGVILPHQNVKDLMLCTSIVEAVKQGKFHIWAIKSIDEGVEIIMGIKAGELRKDGTYTPGSLYAEVNKKLDTFYKTAKNNSKK